jgi:hypothetical protein
MVKDTVDTRDKNSRSRGSCEQLQLFKMISELWEDASRILVENEQSLFLGHFCSVVILDLDYLWLILGPNKPNILRVFRR